MTADGPKPPLTAAQVIDRYFLEHRAKLLDVAAFLDRAQRADGYDADEFRLRAIRDAAALLHDGAPDRARRLLDRWSDPTTTPLDAAPATPVAGVPARHEPRATNH